MLIKKIVHLFMKRTEMKLPRLDPRYVGNAIIGKFGPFGVKAFIQTIAQLVLGFPAITAEIPKNGPCAVFLGGYFIGGLD